mmetsp:Transcript_22900/g.19879  ORF Transcript_22900/g.19879 Transcript_22900/m.19879 type:complete len:100 (-) Transcript_22900:138-437(-)
MSQNEIEKAFREAFKANKKFSGLICLELQGRQHQIAIFKRTRLVLEESYIIPIEKELLHRDCIGFELSRKIEIACQPDDFEFTGLITNFESKDMYLVLN